MTPTRTLRAMALALALAAPLPACVTFDACATSDCSADGAITAAVQSRLEQQPALDVDNIRVQTVHGTVYLNGIVNTSLEVNVAGQLAAVPGATNVVNDLVINR